MISKEVIVGVKNLHRPLACILYTDLTITQTSVDGQTGGNISAENEFDFFGVCVNHLSLMWPPLDLDGGYHQHRKSLPSTSLDFLERDYPPLTFASGQMGGTSTLKVIFTF